MITSWLIESNIDLVHSDKSLNDLRKITHRKKYFVFCFFKTSKKQFDINNMY